MEELLVNSAVPQTQTYSKTPLQFNVNKFQPSSGRLTCSDPEPDLEPDQAPVAVQLEVLEDQVKVTDDPFGELSVSEVNSARSWLLTNKLKDTKNKRKKNILVLFLNSLFII